MAADTRVVVVGAGIAGVRLVEALRAADFGGSLTVIDADVELPYDRPPLSKEFLTGVFDEDDVRVWTADRAADLQVDLRLGTAAVGLDAERRRLALRCSDGSADELAYDRLVLATGVVARRPAGLFGHHGVHVLGSLADARSLRDRLRAGPGRLVVVGGGFIGGEVAASAAEHGLDVTLVEAGTNLLPGVLTAGLARPLERLHHAKGVRVLCGTPAARVLGDGTVEAVELADGTRLPADAVLVGLGGAPETTWLRHSGLELGDGILADEYLRTSAEDVYAIGDAARWPDSRTGALVRLQHWESAVRQGAYLARSLLGADTPYHDVPYIWTDQHGARLQIAGAADGDELYFAHGGPEDDTFLALVRRGPHLAGVIALGGGREFNRLRRTLVTSPAWESVVAGVPGS